MSNRSKPPVGGPHTNPRRGRLKSLVIDPAVILRWLKDGRMGRMVLLSERLPEDAMVVAGGYEAPTQRLVLVMESIDWPEVAPHTTVPEMEPPVWGLED